MKLWPHQKKTIEECRQAFRQGLSKLLVYVPTGGGKTQTFITQTQLASQRGVCVLIVVRRRQIVFQTLKRVSEQVPAAVGCIMGSSTRNASANIIVASIDTLRGVLRKNTDYFKRFGLVIVDEAHDCVSPTYHALLEAVEHAYQIGYTGSPFRIGKKGHTHWDKCITPITKAELRDRGVLVPCEMYSPKSVVTTGLGHTGGDYNQKQLYERTDVSKVYSDIVSNFKKIGRGRAAICFAVNVQHSKNLVKTFREAGVPSLHLDATSTQNERDAGIAQLRSYSKGRKPFVLCNVNILSTGVDIPEFDLLISARGTSSRVLWEQTIGRVLRSSPETGKKMATIIDHAGNFSRFGDPYEFCEPELDDCSMASRKKSEPLGFTCPSCFVYLAKKPVQCPKCKAQFAVSPTNMPEEIDDELVRVVGEDIEAGYKRLKFKYSRRGPLDHIKKAAAARKLYETHGDECISVLSRDGISQEFINSLRKRALRSNIMQRVNFYEKGSS